MAGPLHSRRQFLGAGIGVAAAAALAACGSSTTKRAASVAPAGSDLGAVEHVVMLMQENRSFDHYFGSYRGVRGFDDHVNRQAFTQAFPGGTATDGRLLPFHLDTATSKAECTFDLSHAWTAQHASWAGGSMSRFVATHTESQYEGLANGILTMGYYNRSDLPFHYALADAFTIGDGYFCSVLGPTHPNRLHWMTGTLGPDGTKGGPILTTYLTPDHQWTLSWATMPEVLEDAGVSWKIYNPPGAGYAPGSSTALLLSDNMMLYFDQYKDPSTALHRKAFGSSFPSDFTTDVAAGTLPAVSWVIPPIGYDEHPPAPPALGAWYIHQVLDILTSNPEVWAKTVLFITWDENDGFFDHVPPPVPPAGTAGEYVTASPLPSDAGGIAGPIGLGMRVPLLVVSPFSRGGYVVHDTFDHTSQLRFLETRFGVRAPNISAWRRSHTGDLTSTLDVTTPDPRVPGLPATPKKPAVVTDECSAAQLIELNVAVAPYSVPLPQTMPTQEPGTARVR
ncbi:MAG: twin-arginine translocation signal domain-containing protein [Actinomycetota bacterium]|jgi:phospholipase C|nr:twin-arginine translocation signal domain-containing protein [Actinomycetota bacterium]